MEELIQFVNLKINELDPIVVSAIFHKQMVLIHPFMDGNGRTTRLCTKILLAHLGLNTFNLFSFENFYNKNVTRYFKTAGERGNYYELIDKIDFTSWIEYFSEGIIDELLRVKKELEHSNINSSNILEKHHELILKTLKEKGYINDKIYAQITERAKATRALDFKKLIELGLIKREGRGKNTIYKMLI